jgi:tetratricopeptide (TPR) repeat protein
MYEKALAIRKAVLPAKHPDIASSPNDMAHLYKSTGDYDQALSVYQVSLAIRKAALPPDHPHIAESLNNLAALHEHRGE